MTTYLEVLQRLQSAVHHIMKRGGCVSDYRVYVHPLTYQRLLEQRPVLADCAFDDSLYMGGLPVRRDSALTTTQVVLRAEVAA